MCGPLAVSGAQTTDEVVFERLYVAFVCIDTVIGWFYKLPSTIFCAEIFFERCQRLIFCDIEGWLVSFFCQFGEDLIKCFDDGFVLYICNWECKNIVGVVIIYNKKILFAIEGNFWECSSGICVECALLFVCKCCITKNDVCDSVLDSYEEQEF